jgi:hypothetical protein
MFMAPAAANVPAPSEPLSDAASAQAAGPLEALSGLAARLHDDAPLAHARVPAAPAPRPSLPPPPPPPLPPPPPPSDWEASVLFRSWDGLSPSDERVCARA